MELLGISRSILLILVGMVCFICRGETQDSTGIEVVRGNIMSQYLNDLDSRELDQRVSRWMETMAEDGSFPDIDYEDRSRGVWQPGWHMERIREMATAYIMKGGDYHHLPQLSEQIEKGIDYWIDLPNPPTSDNWYFATITLPRDAGYVLLCMQNAPRPLPKSAVDGLLAWMEKSETIQYASKLSLTRTLAIGIHNIIRGCVTDDNTLVKTASETVGLMLGPDTGFTGIQPDYSFHAHREQLHIHAYGTVLLQRVTQFAEILSGTPYELKEVHLQEVLHFTRNSWLKVGRGRYIDFNVYGRQVARPSNSVSDRLLPLMETMRDLDLSANRQHYDAAIARFSGTQPADYKVIPEHLQFWSSDYHAHIRPKYFTGLRMVSTRTVKAEKGNGENLLEHFRTDGAMSILVRGHEYHDIFPVWEWNQIPGTTTPALDDLSGHKEWSGNPGNTRFVGGVSDGEYGAATFTMDDYDTQAKKSWFFFDEQIACLGAGIKSSSQFPVYTTINQSLSNGRVTIQTSNGIQHFDKEGVWKNKSVLAVKNDEVGYHFLGEERVQISNRIQTGSWNRINTNRPADLVQKKVFKLHIDHGINPVGGRYAYVIWPAIRTIEDIQPEQLTILENTEKIQAVYHKETAIGQAVFHQAGVLYFGDWRLEVSEPCVVLVREADRQSPQIFLADPTQQLSQIELELRNTGSKSDRWLIDLPGGKLAGQSVQVN